MNVIDIFKKAHRTVRDLFNQLDGSRDPAEKSALARTLCLELGVHAEAEERVFGPAARQPQSDTPDPAAHGATAERQILRSLIADLASSSPRERFFDESLARLREHVELHMVRAEQQMLARLQKTDLDLEEVGALFAQIQAGIRARTGRVAPLFDPVQGQRRARMPCRPANRTANRTATLAAAA